MASKHGFKAIIVGGGIAGLTLANMLERFDIDYVLLEGHDHIIPNIGASIALSPNGLLVLDQLGVYEAIREVSRDGEIDNVHIYDMNRETLSWTKNLEGHTERRWVYLGTQLCFVTETNQTSVDSATQSGSATEFGYWKRCMKSCITRIRFFLESELPASNMASTTSRSQPKMARCIPAPWSSVVTGYIASLGPR